MGRGLLSINKLTNKIKAVQIKCIASDGDVSI